MAKPINVLHLRDTYEIGGPGKTILETFRVIDSSRFRLHVGILLSRSEPLESPFVAAAREYGMPVHAIRGVHRFDPRLPWRVVDLVRALDIDILHAHEAKSDVIAYLVSKIHRVATITTMHGWIANDSKQRLFTALDKRVARKLHCVIAVSAAIRDELRAAGVPDAVLELVHNAIVLDRYRRTGRQGILEGLLGRPVARPVVVSIGRLSAEKGHADLVDAAAIVVRRGHAISLVLAGDGPELPRLRQRVQNHGLRDRVYFPGYVNQPRDLFEEADLMVLPSHTEGLPNAALEALAMEVPVLATRVGGTPEVITDGETGRLVPPRSPEALADAMTAFLSDPAPWRAMAKRGRDEVERRFDFRVRTRRLEGIYAELLDRRPA